MFTEQDILELIQTPTLYDSKVLQFEYREESKVLVVYINDSNYLQYKGKFYFRDEVEYIPYFSKTLQQGYTFASGNTLRVKNLFELKMKCVMEHIEVVLFENFTR